MPLLVRYGTESAVTDHEKVAADTEPVTRRTQRHASAAAAAAMQHHQQHNAPGTRPAANAGAARSGRPTGWTE